ncbi:Uncharacterised protein g11404 [Pycnogonum litorale]
MLRDHLPIEEHLINVQQLRSNLKLGPPNVELDRYLEFQRVGNDLVTFKKFCEYLQTSSRSDLVSQLFNVYRNDEDDEVVDFRGYMLDLCLLCSCLSNNSTNGNASSASCSLVKLAFQVLDMSGGHGKIREQQLHQLMDKVYSLDPSQTSKLFKDMDIGNNGYITYDDFVNFTNKKSFLHRLVDGFSEVLDLTENSENVNVNACSNESPSKMKSE